MDRGRFITELQYRLRRTAAQLMLDRAIREIPQDPKRSVRKLVDFGSCLALDWEEPMFDWLERFVRSSSSPYFAFVHNLVGRVSAEAIRTVCTNLVCASLGYGAELLRRRSQALGRPLPWLLVLDGRQANVGMGGALEQVRQARRLGVYTFLMLCPRLDLTIRLARQEAECLFFAISPVTAVDETYARQAAEAPNLILCLEPFPSQAAQREAAFSALQRHRCLYGCAIAYTGQDMEALTSKARMDELRHWGCSFAGFASKTPDAQAQEAMLRRVRALRSPHGKPLLAVELRMELQKVAGWILGGSQPLRLPLGDAASVRRLAE